MNTARAALITVGLCIIASIASLFGLRVTWWLR